jgi:hypothetical protein
MTEGQALTSLAHRSRTAPQLARRDRGVIGGRAPPADGAASAGRRRYDTQDARPLPPFSRRARTIRAAGLFGKPWYAAGPMRSKGERRKGEVFITADGAPVDRRWSLAAGNYSPTRPMRGCGRSGPLQLTLPCCRCLPTRRTRFYQTSRWSVIAPIRAGPLSRRRQGYLVGVGAEDGRRRALAVEER